MINSTLLNSFRSSVAAEQRTFPTRRWGIAATLAVFLVASLFAGAGSVHAQDSPVVSAVSPVNINTADADTLASALKGIGSSRAIEIVRYRESYGPFTSVDELAEVKGIGKATLDQNRAAITLE
jgi:competence protein ComEA